MIKTLVLLGVTGDLAGRFLLPALARLHQAGRLFEDFWVVGGARGPPERHVLPAGGLR